MELHSVPQPFHHRHLGDERHQMLNLNRRLEVYLGRVKVLEEENELLHKEIRALRRSTQGASSRRKGLETELCQVRLEVDVARRERDHTELEVSSLAEELRALGLQRQREAEAQMEAEMKLEESRKEMEEEQREQTWLREKANQLEEEIQLMVQTHQEDVAQMEATLTHPRHTMPPTLALMGKQMPNLLQLGQEYSQRAARAQQEAAEAYQGQVSRMEETLNQAMSRLTQVDQEKCESQLRLRALHKELTSAQDKRLHLEETVARQRDRHRQEIQQLQDRLEDLEVERDELGQQIDRLLVDSRALLQLKMSLGLEVTTYRALLDNESLRGDVSSVHQPRNIYITDAVSSPRGVKYNYQTQLSPSHKPTPLSSVHGAKGRSKPAVITTTSIWTRRPGTLNETKFDEEAAKSTKSSTWLTPLPKALQSGTGECFRPQEVHKEVSSEPLSPPNEQETLSGSSHGKPTAGGKEREEDWVILDAGLPEEGQHVESAVSYQVESGLSSEPPFNNEVMQHQYPTGTLTSYHVRMAEESFGCSESDKDVPFNVPANKEEMPEPHAPSDAWVEKRFMLMEKEAERVQDETSESETEAVLEPTLESSTSSPASECEPEESMFDQLAEFSQEENISSDVAGATSQQNKGSIVRKNEREFEDMLYPDGEEMDTWDSVIETKVDLKKEDGMKKDEAKTQHAEPEEDISAREPEHEVKAMREEVASIVQHDGNRTSSLVDTKLDDNGQHAHVREHVQLPDGDEEEDDEEEDSQNVSVSWRTELESDSYAQDNTLADTRPLIRYKSDETDANTQASHMDESESSEGEEDKKAGDTGTGIWSESKSKRSGTMDDLCEEAEGVALDEEYDLGYTHIEDRDVSHGMAMSENATLEMDEKLVEDEIITKNSEGNSDEELEELMELVEPTVLSDVDYNEELEMVDRLVEQELESLSTATYSAHFTQQQTNVREAVLHLQEEADKTREVMVSCAEPEVTAQHKLTSSTTIIDQPCERPNFRDTSVEMLHTDALAEEEVQHEYQGTTAAPEKREEEEEHNLSMVTHADITEDHSFCSDLNSMPESQSNMKNLDMEESNSSEDDSRNASQCSQPFSTIHVTADQENVLDVIVPDQVKEALSLEISSAPLEHSVEDVADCRASETDKWEVVENPSEDFETRGQNEDGQICDDAYESTQSCVHNEGSTHLGAMTQNEESPEVSPDGIPAEADIFLLKDSTEPLKTNGKDKELHGLFSSGVNNDFWASSMETGATYQPDDSYNKAAEQSNQNLGFDDSLVWRNLAKPNVANGNSRMDNDSSKALVAKEEEEQRSSESKQLLRSNVDEGELVHSEDSEDEGESWSSGEE